MSMSLILLIPISLVIITSLVIAHKIRYLMHDNNNPVILGLHSTEFYHLSALCLIKLLNILNYNQRGQQ